MKTIILSDLEGESINRYNHLDDPTNKIIICGDIIDSTILNSKLGNTISQENKHYLNTKSFNLYNLKEIYNNKNINFVLGNRDLNKIKCLILHKLSNKDNSVSITDFNDGNHNISDLYEFYNEIKKLNLSWEEDIKNWSPFWDIPKIKTIEQVQTKLNDDKYNNNKQDDNNFFFNRYNIIFDYTMGVKNLLYTLPYELGITFNNCTCSKNEKCICYTEKIFDDNNKDFLAFVVLILFNSLLKNTTNNNEDNHLYNYKGLLYNVLIKGSLCLYLNATDKKKIVLFSHGGITSDVLNTFENLLDSKIDLENFKFENLSNSSQKKEIILNNKKLDNFNIDKFIEKIKNINKKYKDIINSIFTKTSGVVAKLVKVDTPSNQQIDGIVTKLVKIDTSSSLQKNNIIKIIIISANTSINYFIENTTCKNTESCSPVLGGYNKFNDDNLFNITGYEIVQMLGHQPLGYASSIKKYEKYQMIIINLDTSNSFNSTIYNNESQNYVTIDSKIVNNENTNDKNANEIANIEITNSKISLFSIINTTEEIIIKKYNEVAIDNLIQDNSVFISDTFKTSTNINLTIDIDINNIKLINLIKLNTDYYFYNHGQHTRNKDNFYVFTIINIKKMFEKSLFILTMTDLLGLGNQFNVKFGVDPELINLLKKN